MKEQDLLKAIAPCGLVCHTCTAARDGAIQNLSQSLQSLLDGFDSFAERFSAFQPTLKKYPDFKAVLQLFAGASCEGCRSGKCVYPSCPIAPCVHEKGIRFCFECDSFPCDKMRADAHLGKVWVTNNRRMREIGVEAYSEEVNDRSHYA